MRKAVTLTAALAFACVGLLLPSAQARTSVVPDRGTIIDATIAHSIKGAQRVGTSWVVPLRAAKPDWLTPELEAAVKRDAERGGRGKPAPNNGGGNDGGGGGGGSGGGDAEAQLIPDLPASGFVGIRPGSWMLSPSGCTMNFVFQSGGQYGIGTAGHCVDKVGDHVILLTAAPNTENPVLVDIGQVVKRADNEIGDDFALVAIRPELNDWVFPTIAQVAGPCGTYSGAGLAQVPVPQVFKGQASTLGPETIWHYGHGVGVGTGGTPRSGAALYWTNDAYYWTSPAAPGDSGSPARVTTLAGAGNLTHLVVDTHFPGAAVAGTRLTKIAQIAGSWSLVSSPYC